MSKTVYLDPPQNSEGQEILTAILSTAGLDPDWCDNHDPINAIVINGKEGALEELRVLMRIGSLLTAVHRYPSVSATHVKRLLKIGTYDDFESLILQVAEWQNLGFERREIDGLIDHLAVAHSESR